MADRAITIGFWLNAILMIVKLLAGYYGDSEAVFADGIESACDFVAIISTLIALRIGRKTFDDDHPYGHGKAECMAAIMVSLVIFAAGFGILYKAVMTFVTGHYPQPQLMAVAAAAATIVIKEILFRYTRRVARKLESPAVEAVSKDHRKDALTSVATLIGVTGAYFGFAFLDPLAAGLTSFFIFYIGWETLKKTVHDLMDGRPPQNVLSQICDTACEISGVDRVHEIRGRRSGQYLIIDLKLEMDPEMTVRQSHEIADQVKNLIFSRFSNVGDVMIHINPSNQAHKDLIRL
ncbi:MAG TPA: cation diffusion facilitator family transporter [Smithellaceae bacterium]|mgnify:FL=1|jgi:cation diffusion facilitator family transporter|nr:cation diffusion facilitator family transporter [Smithellaceae bacterium]HOH56396.1 cation diffusion facilitator family transporter [Smithellaceae bacterium]HPB14841.1 cation diffusion facilitator family transporter [Smithellaceae bacterium]HPL32449.1 cation diffusion facilitator family transporter [Smithellaceae bacterium]HPV73201.1 cation diffusion facilitator family transporter [Smithellaceae bacterium]